MLGAFCRLIRVEEAVLQGQGCVVRLAGLYHAQVWALQHSPVLASRRTHSSHILNLHKNSTVFLERQGCVRRLANHTMLRYIGCSVVLHTLAGSSLHSMYHPPCLTQWHLATGEVARGWAHVAGLLSWCGVCSSAASLPWPFRKCERWSREQLNISCVAEGGPHLLPAHGQGPQVGRLHREPHPLSGCCQACSCSGLPSQPRASLTQALFLLCSSMGPQ